MPEPNLPPLYVNVKNSNNIPGLIDVCSIEQSLPELPEETRQKLTAEYTLTPEIAVILTVNYLCLINVQLYHCFFFCFRMKTYYCNISMKY